MALARREMMLGIHRFRLRREDLEDCYSQATLELFLAVEAGREYAGRDHIANALELRFVSRIRDRRRAISGRSPMQTAMEGAVALVSEEMTIEIEDRRSEPERVALEREELGRLRDAALQLSDDQRLVLASQLAQDMDCDEFCQLHGWSPEKYRKVAQRGRARLRRLMSAEGGVPSPRRGSDQDTETRL